MLATGHVFSSLWRSSFRRRGGLYLCRITSALVADSSAFAAEWAVLASAICRHGTAQLSDRGLALIDAPSQRA